MEANRLNITKEKPPTVIFTNSGNPFVQTLSIKDKGQAEVEFEVLEQALELDENNNSIIRYTIGIVKAHKLEEKNARVIS